MATKQATTTPSKPATTTPAKALPSKPAQPANVPTPANTQPAPTGKRSNAAWPGGCKAGVTYGIQCTVAGGASVVLPFQLPPSCKGKGEFNVSMGAQANKWIGRDGHELKAHVCYSEHGTVVLQPHPTHTGYKATAYPKGHTTGAEITVQAL